ncbi:MAG: SRPBCC family protein, partial [Verrucomicrobiota bacterium]
IGLTMSVRRAVDVGFSPWFGVGFLVPLWNWLTIVALCFAPSTEENTWSVDKPGELLPVDLRTVLGGIAIGAGLSLIMVLFSVHVLGDYGWSLFIGTPFVVGMVTGYQTNRKEPRSAKSSVWVATLAILLGGATLLLFALEGIICVLMAGIPAIVLAIGGALIGHAIAHHARSKASVTNQLASLILFLPLFAGIETLDRNTTVYEVETAVEINAPPLEVWPNVIDFPDLPPPPRIVQWSGIAYPMRARLEGEGVGAIRHCEFSTGAFVEPITVWEPGRRLAFDVTSQPHPLQEWSPYHDIHPPHLDGYFRSIRGEFRFIELPNNRTRLEGSTWYEIDIAPAGYWSLISDLVIHRIHLQVLDHVKREAERAAP